MLSPSRLLQPLADSPSSVTIIDRDTIEASGFTEVADLFRLVPGFSVSYADSITPTMTYHGLGDGEARRFQVLIDGRSIYSPVLGQVSWSNLPLSLDDIERIEVIRGPAGASYGANAFMGVINIVTRSGELGKTYAEVSAGKHGQLQVGTRLTGADKAVHWRLSAGSSQNDGLDVSHPDDVFHYFADWKSEWQIDRRNSLGFEAGASNAGADTLLSPFNMQSRYLGLRWTYEQSLDSQYLLGWQYQ